MYSENTMISYLLKKYYIILKIHNIKNYIAHNNKKINIEKENHIKTDLHNLKQKIRNKLVVTLNF